MARTRRFSGNSKILTKSMQIYNLSALLDGCVAVISALIERKQWQSQVEREGVSISFHGDRRNSKPFNGDDKEQKIMMKQTHFPITKRPIIDYSVLLKPGVYGRV